MFFRLKRKEAWFENGKVNEGYATVEAGILG